MFSLPTKSTGRALFAVTVALACTPAAAVAQDLRSPDARDAALAQERYYGSYQNDANAAGARTDAVHRAVDLRSPDTRDVADGRHNQPTPTVITLKPSPAPEPVAARGSSWVAAAGGAGATLGLILLMTAGVLLRRRARREQPVAGA
jgi:hypothetical protein